MLRTILISLTIKPGSRNQYLTRNLSNPFPECDDCCGADPPRILGGCEQGAAATVPAAPNNPSAR
jgi:hypothetical protein